MSTNKRQAASPLQGSQKESRDDSFSIESDSEVVVQTVTDAACVSVVEMSEPDTAVQEKTYASAAASNEDSNRGVATSGFKSVFKTQKPQGAFRDEVVVEVHSVNGQPYKGTVTPREARRVIFEDKLGFSQEALSGCIIGYSRCRIVTFKLKEVFDIDTLHMIENFQFERTSKDREGLELVSTLSCKIRGIRRSGVGTDGGAYRDEGLRWVKVEGCEYRLEQEQIKVWLSFFGEVRSEIVEDTFDDDSDNSDGYPAIGNGIYSVQMKIASDIPQLVPMHGKRIRLYYRGIAKLCSNCFGQHARKFCKAEKVPWIEYVSMFMSKYPEIPIEMYDKWSQAVEVWKTQSGYVKPVGASNVPESLPGGNRAPGKGKGALPEGMVETMLSSLRLLPQSIATVTERYRQKPIRVSPQDQVEPVLPSHGSGREEESTCHSTKPAAEQSRKQVIQPGNEVTEKTGTGRGRGRRKGSL